jgi:hypothetical protein
MVNCLVWTCQSALPDEQPPEDLFCEGSKSSCEGSKSHPSHPSEPASEAASDTTKKQDCEGCEGYNQEVPYSTPHEDVILPFYGYTLHTLHKEDSEEGIKQPLEPCEGTVKGQETPYTPEIDPSQVAAIPDDFTYEAEECLQCGCGLTCELDGSQVCVRCYPPKGYHVYSHLVDMIYPRKSQVAFGKGVANG